MGDEMWQVKAKLYEQLKKAKKSKDKGQVIGILLFGVAGYLFGQASGMWIGRESLSKAENVVFTVLYILGLIVLFGTFWCWWVYRCGSEAEESATRKLNELETQDKR